MLPESIFAKKRFLITDDMVDMRSAIKRLVEVIGGQQQNIEICSDGEEAIAILMKNKYDIILCDYSLGEGKDGQQVLEEARFRDILPHSSVFMLLTAESTADMVMGALEYEPDGYIVKPFTKDMFHQRLEKVLHKKIKLAAVYKALDEKNPEKAIAACDNYLAENTVGVLACKKLKASILLDMNKVEAAKTIYQEVLAEKEVLWAQHGLGKVYYYEESYDQAIELFEKIIVQNPVCVEPYDWLAKTCMECHKYEMAEKALQTAVKLSPKAILRQQALGLAARSVKNVELAEKAYRQSIKLGRNSCYQELTDYYHLMEALITKTFSDAGMASKRAGNEAVSLMDDFLKVHHNNKVLQFQASVLRGAALAGLGRVADAKTALAQSDKFWEGLSVVLSVEMYLCLARVYSLQGAKEQAYKMLTEVLKHYPSRSALKKEVNELVEKGQLGSPLEGALAGSSRHEDFALEELQRKSLQLLNQGQARAALGMSFSLARTLDANFSVQAHAVQLACKFMSKYGEEPSVRAKAEQLLDAMKRFPLDQKKQGVVEELLKSLKEGS